MFGDIKEDIGSLNLLDIDQSMDSLPDEWISIRDDSEDLALWDSYMLQSFQDCSQVTHSDDNENSMEQSLAGSSFN